ncbi:glycoside hydrolase family 35 protein [Sphaerosporella brunnea]|uniref:Beta-galactosidase n=1 Tax=Sphaerosporella brunnea TaxID=1250544 RepID=A0A5J5EFY0_9PEZI|nr:glycoside hydrolase family 35 protein [Sphaerosporella brunnea]
MWVSRSTSVGILAIATLFQTLLAAPSTSPVRRRFANTPADLIIPRDDNGLQDVVTWDNHSLLIHGKRVMIWSGEFHPWRLPVTGLWLDVFEKIKALGFNAVSFYVHWGLVEHKRGTFDFDGYRSYKPFFDAAKKAGIYLIARPGPYINAEVTGGGFPGWGTRVNVAWRTGNETYLEAIKDFVYKIGEIIAPEQITNGGPVILLQPENEFSAGTGIPWPQPKYMQILQDWFRDAGIVVPMILNDVSVSLKNYVPNSGEGEVDIYGYDGYPLGFDCANPYRWPSGSLPTTWYEQQLKDSPTSPNAVMEFQGGAFDPWGGPSYEACAILLNHEFERVFYKNDISFATTIWNIYMTFGGTNWGGLAYPGVYTSYDYGSAITEYRAITREKYSELKLEANFLKVSPAYLTSKPQNLIPSTIGGAFTNNYALSVTQLKDEVGNKTAFYVVRHSTYNTLNKTTYIWTAATSKGTFSVPHLQGSLTLDGRDSKIHVTDYSIGDNEIVYSSGEVFTWKAFGDTTVVVLYGSPGETHETAFTAPGSAKVSVVSGDQQVSSSTSNGSVILNYKTVGKTVVKVGSSLVVYICDRNEAYKFWVPDLPGADGSAYSTEASVIVQGAYLIRSATIKGSLLQLSGDLNATDAIEVFAPATVKSFNFNNQKLSLRQTSYGSWSGQVVFTEPKIMLPSLKDLKWKYTDSLPEISSKYDDSKWTVADKDTTPNPRKLTTPTDLYSSDYGYHVGNLVYRGHFTATGQETAFNITVQGGNAFGFSVWLNSELLGSSHGYDAGTVVTKSFSVSLKKGSRNIITVLQDHQGLNEDWTAGSEDFKVPRGILYYSFSGSPSTSVSWKMTGNLGGEDYADKTRGPFNEGGLYAERQGFHLPGYPTGSWKTSSPLDGIQSAGVAFYKTSFDLNLPEGYDIPLAFTFGNCTESPNFRAQLYVNGYQFGKYANNVGPQKVFPVPEGIINHRGKNALGVSLWAMDDAGAKLCGLELEKLLVVQSGFGSVAPSEQPVWRKRLNAY